MKRNRLKKSESFKADMQTIKKEDVRKLQETFSRFFGATPDQMKKYSSNLRNKIYFFGFIASVFFALLLYLTKNVKFVGL
tara:strand:- start:744 stop:983 length:240 start_codon:yes stop_codon:yes gene_type:complete